MRFEHYPFVNALRSAIEDEEVSPRVRRALASVSNRREDAPVGGDERRLWALLPAIRAGRVDEGAIVDLAIRITSSE